MAEAQTSGGGQFYTEKSGAEAVGLSLRGGP